MEKIFDIYKDAINVDRNAVMRLGAIWVGGHRYAEGDEYEGETVLSCHGNLANTVLYFIVDRKGKHEHVYIQGDETGAGI